eukprot:5346245-Amphidinium_carterae.1
MRARERQTRTPRPGEGGFDIEPGSPDLLDLLETRGLCGPDGLERIDVSAMCSVPAAWECCICLETQFGPERDLPSTGCSKCGNDICGVCVTQIVHSSTYRHGERSTLYANMWESRLACPMCRNDWTNNETALFWTCGRSICRDGEWTDLGGPEAEVIAEPVTFDDNTRREILRTLRTNASHTSLELWASKHLSEVYHTP